MTLKKIHQWSGIGISLFISIHLFNHLYSIFGINKHLEVMNALRMVYRNNIIETILLVSIFLQIISGIALFARKRTTASGFFEQLQIWTGLYLAFFLLIHISAILVGRYYLQLNTNFYFGAAGINIFPFNLFFIPYYTLAIMAWFGHLSAIHHSKAKKAIIGLMPSTQAKIILILGAITTTLIFYGFTNHFEGIQIPEMYKVLIGK